MALPHTYIIGASGTGKSTHLKHLAIEHIRQDGGLLFLDPHGEDATDLLEHIPRKRRRDVILFDPIDFPLAWNILDAPAEQHPLIASTMVDTIRTTSKLTAGGTATMDLYVYNAVAAMLETGGTLAAIPDMLRDKSHRQAVTAALRDSPVKRFWQRFEDYTGKEQRDETRSTYNKFYPLLADPRIRRVIDHQRSAFSLPDILERSGILIVRLPQGNLGLGKTELLGSLFLSQAHVTALSRQSRAPFLFMLDEVHLWAPSVVAELLSGVRKFGVQVVASHQYVRQLPSGLFDAFQGNAERHVFRVSEEDAERFQRRFHAHDSALNLDELPDFVFRTFPYQPRDVDVTVSPLPEPFRRSRSDIEQRMRTDVL